MLNKALERLPQSTQDRLKSFPPVYYLRNAIWRWRLSDATHDEIYGESYFQMVEDTTTASAEVIADSLVSHFAPSTVVDVGCGTGALMESLRARDVSSYGIEYADAALEYCRRRGLSVLKLDLGDQSDVDSVTGKYDVAISMEVGQQLSPAAADHYIDLLCRFADVVVFSSDTPGGFDRRPLNEQRPDYWREKFAARGFELDESLTMKLRRIWEERETASWFYRNLMIFRQNASSGPDS
jgi:SAM-dependent methyltransferase